MADHIIDLPAGRGTGQVRIDLTQISSVEARLAEVQYVTKEKAPELLTALNRAIIDLGKVVRRMAQEKREAERGLGVRKATVLLDLMPQILAEKNIDKPNEAIRDAVLVRDEEYMRFKDLVDAFTAVVDMLRVKLEGLERGHGDVRKILDGRALPALDLGHSPHSIPTNAFPPTGLKCAVCNFEQYETPSGPVCVEGHGGAPGYDPRTKER